MQELHRIAVSISILDAFNVIVNMETTVDTGKLNEWIGHHEHT